MRYRNGYLSLLINGNVTIFTLVNMKILTYYTIVDEDDIPITGYTVDESVMWTTRKSAEERVDYASGERIAKVVVYI
jgi:hypothetical protein